MLHGKEKVSLEVSKTIENWSDGGDEVERGILG